MISAKKKKIGVDRGIGRYYGTIRSQYAHRDEKITERCKLRKKRGVSRSGKTAIGRCPSMIELS